MASTPDSLEQTVAEVLERLNWLLQEVTEVQNDADECKHRSRRATK